MENQTNTEISKSSSSNKILLVTGIVSLVVCFFAVGFIFGRESKITTPTGGINTILNPTDTTGTSDAQSDVNMDLFWNVWNTMKDYYVDPAKGDQQKMYYGAIKGMVESYGDQATLFLDPEETANFNNANTGKLFEGIGAELGYNQNSNIIIVAPINGSPAQKAGVLPGDIIYKVDGVEVKTTDKVEDIVTKIRGKAGTEVKLTFIRKGADDPVEITITRGQITVPSLSVKKVSELDVAVTDLDSSVPVISISRFTEESDSAWNAKWDQAVTDVLNSNAKGLVIDLRNNPGGYLNSAVHAANEFLPKGAIIVKQQDRAGDEEVSKADGTGRLQNIPVVILVNEGSASASEIFSGALKLNNRAKVVGMKTYGKGTAQAVVNLPDDASLHVTVAKWLLPDGSWLNRDNPITPDYEVDKTTKDFEAAKDPQVDKAIEVLRSLMK